MDARFQVPLLFCHLIEMVRAPSSMDQALTGPLAHEPHDTFQLVFGQVMSRNELVNG